MRPEPRSAAGLAAVGGWALAVLALGAVAALRGGGALWGANAWAFLPRPGLWIALAISLAAGAFAGRGAGFGSGAWRRFAHDFERSPWLAALLAGAAFWWLRDATLLIGDGLPLVARLLQGGRPAVLEPGAMAALAGAHAVLRPPLLAAGASEFGAAWASAALVSVAAGAAFVACVVRIANRLAAPASAPGLATLLALALCVQGYAQVFMGHAESYGLVAMLFALYVLLVLEALGGERSLAPAGLVLGVSLVTHLMSAVLVPSFAWAAIVLWRRAASARVRAGIALSLAGAAAVAALGSAALLPSAGPAGGAGVLRTVLRQLAGESLHLPLDPADLARRGFRFLNGQWLAGPWSAVGLALAGALLALSRRAPGAAASFLLVLGLSAVAASALAGESNLGYARNWDLLAPLAFLSAAAACAALVEVLGADAARRSLALVVVASLFGSAPWFAVSASEPRSLARFASLPLGGSEAASSVGWWHALMGRGREAEDWLLRAERDDSTNVRARLALGKLYFGAGNLAASRERYAVAARLRPDLLAPVPGLVAALLAQRRDAEATAAVAEELGRHPSSAGAWASAAALRRLEGEGAAAAALADSARARDPGNPALGAFRDSLALPPAPRERIVRLLRRLAES